METRVSARFGGLKVFVDKYITNVLWGKDGITISQLSAQTSLANATLTSMLDRMEASGLIRREPSPRDRRALLIRLTDKARSLQADYFGTADGRDADKMDVSVEWEKGQNLDVPVLKNTPCAFELELEKEIPTDDQDNVILLCRIRNTLKEESILDPALTTQDKYKTIAAVRTTGDQDYWSLDGRHLGKWHEPAQKIKPGVQIGKAAQGN